MLQQRTSFLVIVLLATLITEGPLSAQRRPAARPQPAPVLDFFDVHEQSILDLQAAQAAGKVTARGLVDSYLARIQAYDQAGPRLNAIVLVNPRAREESGRAGS